MIRILIFWIVTAGTAFAQCSDTWVTGIGAPPNGNAGYGRSSIEIADGAVYVMGQMAGSESPSVGGITFPIDPVVSFTRLFYITRMSMLGEPEWFFSAQCTSTPSAEATMLVDEDGNAYLSGSFVGQLVMEDTTLEQSNGSCFLLKVNREGDLLWAKQTEGSSIPRMTWKNGNLLMPIAYTGTIEFSWDGTTRVSDGQLDFIIAELDTDGQVIQTNEIKGLGQATVYDITHLDNRTLIQGRFDEELIYDGTVIQGSEPLEYRSYQLMIAEGGAFVWSKVSNIHEVGGANHTGALRFEEIMISMGSFGTPTYSIDAHSLTLQGNSDGYILCQNVNTGEVNWLVGFGGDGYQRITGVSKLNGNQIAIWGDFKDSFDFSGESFINEYSEFTEPFLTVIDTSRKIVCQKTLANSNGDDWINNITPYNGAIYSIVHHLIDRELDDINADVLGSRQNTVWKTCLPCDTLTSILTPLREIVLLQNDPNPFADYTDIRLSLPQSAKNASLLVVDMKGTVMLNVPLNGGHETIRVYSSDIGKGIFTYYLLNEGNVVASRKMVSSK
jgi:hypothetical protein